MDDRYKCRHPSCEEYFETPAIRDAHEMASMHCPRCGASEHKYMYTVARMGVCSLCYYEERSYENDQVLWH